MQIVVTFAQFQAIVEELGPHQVIVYSDGSASGTGDGVHVVDSVAVLNDRLGGGLFVWNGTGPTLTDFAATYPNAFRVGAVV